MQILPAATAKLPVLNAQQDVGRIAKIIAVKPAKRQVNARLYVNCKSVEKPSS